MDGCTPICSSSRFWALQVANGEVELDSVHEEVKELSRDITLLASAKVWREQLP